MRLHNNMNFKDFMINENAAYLGERVGDILTALSELQQNLKGMGKRQTAQTAEGIVNQIRRLLHSSWKKEDIKNLVPLQKIGAAIMRSIEEKDDMETIIASSLDELQKLSEKLGQPLNNLGSPESESPQANQSSVQPPQKAAIKPKQQQQVQPQGQATQQPSQQ